MRASMLVWMRSLLLALVLLVSGPALAQAPPPTFFAGRSDAELRALASDPRNDVLLRRSAATRLVLSLADHGELDAADAAGRTFSSNIDPAALEHVHALRRRGRVHVAAVAALGIALGIAFQSLVRGRRLLRSALQALRRIGPLLVGFLVYAGLMGGYLASTYENSDPLPFVLFAGFLLPLIAVFRLWSAVGSSSATARAGRGAAAVAATVALGFLVVEQVNPMFLEGFGL